MDKLNSFYKELCAAYSIKVSEEGYLMLTDTLPYVIDNKTLVLPTKDNLDNVISKDASGKLTVTKIIFNPLGENPIKGDTVSLKEVKKWTSLNIGSGIEGAGKLLLLLASSKDAQKKTTMMTNEFLAKINEANNANIKEIVDNKSIESWDKIWDKINGNAIFVASKKLGVVNGTKYTRLGSLSVSLYDSLCNEGVDSVADVKLRRKDIIVFKTILEFLLPELVEKKVIYAGTNDTESPALISILLLMDIAMDVVVKVGKELSALHMETYDNLIPKWDIKRDDILLCGMNYKSQVGIVPGELDFVKEKSKEINVVENNKVLSTTLPANIGVGGGYNPYMKQDQFAPTTMSNAPVEKPDPLLAVLNNINNEKRMSFIASNSMAMNPYAQPQVFNPAMAVNPYAPVQQNMYAPVNYQPQQVNSYLPANNYAAPVNYNPGYNNQPQYDAFGRPIQQQYNMPVVDAARHIAI